MDTSIDRGVLIDQDRVRWIGSGSAIPENTVFHLFDDDVEFQKDCYNGAIWAGLRLGFPNVDVELADKNFYACFEESVFEYGAQVNQWNIRNYINNFQGVPVQSLGNLSGQYVKGTPINFLVELSKQYGTDVGVGGNTSWKRGFIVTTAMSQSYDLQELWGNPSESFQRIEIMRVFHNFPPAFARIYDPFSMTGMAYSNVLNELGFGAYSPAVQFLMTPIFEDLLRGQAIQFNDMVRKSAFSFEVVNNKLKLFPIPSQGFKVYFDYLVSNERISGSFVSNQGIVSDYANIPYNIVPYNTINQVGRTWIRKYFLSLCKELLGAIRQKYMSIPIPGGEFTLDGAELRNEAQQEKDKWLSELRETLDAVGKKQQMENRALEVDQLQTTLKAIPLFIYKG